MGSPWGPDGTPGVTKGSPWGPMDHHGSPWVPMGSSWRPHGSPCVPMVSPWAPMSPHSPWWFSWGLYESLWRAHGVPIGTFLCLIWNLHVSHMCPIWNPPCVSCGVLVVSALCPHGSQLILLGPHGVTMGSHVSLCGPRSNPMNPLIFAFYSQTFWHYSLVFGII